MSRIQSIMLVMKIKKLVKILPLLPSDEDFIVISSDLSSKNNLNY